MRHAGEVFADVVEAKIWLAANQRARSLRTTVAVERGEFLLLDAGETRTKITRS